MPGPAASARLVCALPAQLGHQLAEGTRAQPGERGCPGRLRRRDHTNHDHDHGAARSLTGQPCTWRQPVWRPHPERLDPNTAPIVSRCRRSCRCRCRRRRRGWRCGPGRRRSADGSGSGHPSTARRAGRGGTLHEDPPPDPAAGPWTDAAANTASAAANNITPPWGPRRVWPLDCHPVIPQCFCGTCGRLITVTRPSSRTAC